MPIRIFGDITIDNFEIYEDFSDAYLDKMYPSDDRSQIEENHPFPGLSHRFTNRTVARQLGGAYLIARKTAAALDLWGLDTRNEVDTAQKGSPISDLKNFSEYKKIEKKLLARLTLQPRYYENFLKLFYRIDMMKDKRYRVTDSGSEGYTLPNSRKKPNEDRDSDIFECLRGQTTETTHLITSDHGDRAALLVDRNSGELVLNIFNDGGTRLRRPDFDWVSGAVCCAKRDMKSWAIVKSHEPKHLKQANDGTSFFSVLKECCDQNVVLVLNSDDLRRHKIAINRGLSWERTVKDVLKHLQNGAVLPGEIPRHVVIVFDFDAALYVMLSDNAAGDGAPYKVEFGCFVFSKDRAEGEYASEFEGSMPGSQTVFVSVLSALIYRILHNSEWRNALEWSSFGDPNKSEKLKTLGLIFNTVLTYALIAKQRSITCGFDKINKSTVFSSIEDVTLDGENEAGGIEFGVIPKVYYNEAVFGVPKPASIINPSPDKAAPSPYAPGEATTIGFFDPIFALNNPQDTLQHQRAFGLSSVEIDEPEDLDDFKIFRKVTKNFELSHYVQYVRDGYIRQELGEGAEALDTTLPICQIGKIKTISRSEISSLRTIRRLIRDFVLHEDEHSSPLGIAVFGQPGSGKSFTVKNIIGALEARARDRVMGAFIECNLSGLSHPEDIAPYFQEARDHRLKGKIPVFFVDEFDCAVNGSPYFWLKHFLAPLQDGVFRSGHATHPIGKCIFVFAGGTSHSYEQFANKVDPRPTQSDRAFAWKDFLKRKASTENGTGRTYDSVNVSVEDQRSVETIKGPDFLSRLQAHIDIKGIVPGRSESFAKGSGAKIDFGSLEERDLIRSEDFKPFLMRRAILIRELLMLRAPSIVTGSPTNERLEIDERIVRAFLLDDKYEHGVRSVEALIRMSALDGRRHFSPDALPPREQIMIHASEKFYDRAFRKGSE
jgi:hypothetical protein